MLEIIHKWVQLGYKVEYEIINQEESGTKKEGEQLYTFYIYFPSEDNHRAAYSVNHIREGFQIALVYLKENTSGFL